MEGRPEGYSSYGGKPLVAVDNVVFLTDKCGDGPWRCEFPEQQKYNIVFRESLEQGFNLYCHVKKHCNWLILGRILVIKFKKYPDWDTIL